MSLKTIWMKYSVIYSKGRHRMRMPDHIKSYNRIPVSGRELLKTPHTPTATRTNLVPFFQHTEGSRNNCQLCRRRVFVYIYRYKIHVLLPRIFSRNSCVFFFVVSSDIFFLSVSRMLMCFMFQILWISVSRLLECWNIETTDYSQSKKTTKQVQGEYFFAVPSKYSVCLLEASLKGFMLIDDFLRSVECVMNSPMRLLDIWLNKLRINISNQFLNMICCRCIHVIDVCRTVFISRRETFKLLIHFIGTIERTGEFIVAAICCWTWFTCN